MALFPGATIELVARYKEGGTSGGAMATCGRAVYHTAVSSSSDLFGLFNTPGNPVAHMYVAGDGHKTQYVDSDRRASAVLDGNYDAFTVETEDIGSPWFKRWIGSNVPKWTDAQVASLAEIAVWLHKTKGIPLKALLTSAPGHKGFGTHRLGCPGNFPTKGILHGWRGDPEEVWTTSSGKVCPGDRRISQLYNEVLPLAQHMLAHENDPTAFAQEPGHVEAALREIRQSIKATKPDSVLRKSLRPIARQLRAILAKKSERHPHEESNGR